MNLFRLLLLLAIAWLLWRLLRPLLTASRTPPKPVDGYEPMARCERCGTYLPANTLSREGRCGRCQE